MCQQNGFRGMLHMCTNGFRKNIAHEVKKKKLRVCTILADCKDVCEIHSSFANSSFYLFEHHVLPWS